MRDPLSGVGMATSLSCEGMLNAGSPDTPHQLLRQQYLYFELVRTLSRSGFLTYSSMEVCTVA